MTHFYHLCGALLEKGSIILLGYYGHILKRVYGRSKTHSLGSPQTLFYEDRLEAYRKLHAPDKPSRFDCVFTCHSLENLKRFANFSGRDYQFGYKVEVVGTILKIHYANWRKYDNKWIDTNNWHDEMEESIASYWTTDASKYLDEPISPLEILLPNKHKVLTRVL